MRPRPAAGDASPDKSAERDTIEVSGVPFCIPMACRTCTNGGPPLGAQRLLSTPVQKLPTFAGHFRVTSAGNPPATSHLPSGTGIRGVNRSGTFLCPVGLAPCFRLTASAGPPDTPVRFRRGEPGYLAGNREDLVDSASRRSGGFGAWREYARGAVPQEQPPFTHARNSMTSIVRTACRG